MSRRVLSVGNCSFDHGALRYLIQENFDAELVAAAGADQALAAIDVGPFDLILVNRKFHADSADGLDLIRRLKSDPAVAATPVMLLSDRPEYQQSAVEAGAEPGFGKSALNDAETLRRLARYLRD